MTGKCTTSKGRHWRPFFLQKRRLLTEALLINRSRAGLSSDSWRSRGGAVNPRQLGGRQGADGAAEQGRLGIVTLRHESSPRGIWALRLDNGSELPSKYN